MSTLDNAASRHHHYAVTGAGAVGAVVADRSCIVYDEAGAVLHVHRRVTLSGGRPVTDDELASSAMAHARTALPGRDVAGGRTLVVDTTTVPPARSLKVDPVALRLVEHRPSRDTVVR